MSCYQGIVLAVVLASASSATVAKAAVIDGREGIAMIAASDDGKMSDADKRAKAIECSKQADAKHLHGDARLKFRAACKEKSSS